MTGQVHRTFPQTLQVPLSGCPITAKGDWDFFSHVPTENFYSCTVPKRLEQRNTSLRPPKPWGSMGVLQFIYTEAGFAARFEPPTPPTATLLDTELSPAISPILSHGLVRTKKLMFDNRSTQNH